MGVKEKKFIVENTKHTPCFCQAGSLRKNKDINFPKLKSKIFFKIKTLTWRLTLKCPAELGDAHIEPAGLGDVFNFFCRIGKYLI